jgi:hypothetical protein
MKSMKKFKLDLDMAVYVSAVLLALGVFLPMTKLPIYGDVSYYRIAPIATYLVVVFALAGPVMLFLKQTKRLFFAPAGVWLVLLFPAIKSVLTPKGKSGMMDSLTSSAGNAFGEYAARLFLNINDFQWGGLIFLLGLLTFTVVCVLKSLRK